MTNRELTHIAKVMYSFQEYCKSLEIHSSCKGCPCVEFRPKDVRGICMLYDDGKFPSDWSITKADIERLMESGQNEVSL